MVLGLRLDKGLKPARKDDDIKEMINYALDVDEIELFYEHHHKAIPIQVVGLPCNEDDGEGLGKRNTSKEQQIELPCNKDDGGGLR